MRKYEFYTANGFAKKSKLKELDERECHCWERPKELHLWSTRTA